ncbi:MAG: hypothetical protein M3Q07_17180 [Pseudobdellovibrionaceae bacterium]|nr:hypothetical protein [Pseudobdellovibrionaceae bacterium]
MAAIAEVGDWIPGRRNRNRSETPGGNIARGHHVYGYWTYNDDGTKDQAFPLGMNHKVFPSQEKLISTAVWNPGKKTWTLLFTHFDLDFKNADPRWIVDGKISWPLVQEHLQMHEPKFFEAIVYVVMSTGGRGLSIVLSIAPFMLCEENRTIESRALHLQTMLIRVLNHHGLGADYSAAGLKRFMPNFKNPRRLIYENAIRRKLVENTRHFVIRELYEAYRSHVACIYIRKTERMESFLHPDFRVEKKLAKLYFQLDCVIAPGGIRNCSLKEICELAGMSPSSFYRSVLARADVVKWLEIRPLGGRKGYDLQFLGNSTYDARVQEILFGAAKPDDREVVSRPQVDFEPADVVDGERNSYLWQAAVKMKHALIPAETAVAALRIIASGVPGYGGRDSWSLRNPERICRSIYKCRPREGNSPVLRQLPGYLYVAVKQAEKQANQAKKAYAKNLDVGTPKGSTLFAVVPSSPEQEVSRFSSQAFPSHTPAGVRPGGTGAGQAPVQVVDTQLSEVNRDVSSTVPSTQVVDTEQSEIYPAASRAIFQLAPIAEPGSAADGMPTRGFTGIAALPQGQDASGSVRRDRAQKAEANWPVPPSELSDDQVDGEFSYQLMRVKLPGEMKIGILTQGFSGLTAAEVLARKLEYLEAFFKLETGHG